MQKRLLIQAVLCLMTIISFGQVTYTYSGKVTNESNEALVGAQLRLLVANRVLGITNVAGEFYVETDEPSLKVVQIGYMDMQIMPEDSSIVMVEKSSLLNTIVVSENKRSSELKNATISIEIISPDLIANTAPTNLEESIGRINGVQVVDNQPTIRSGSGWSYGAGSRVQVLVDGVPTLRGDAGQPLWNFVPTEGVDGVEV